MAERAEWGDTQLRQRLAHLETALGELAGHDDARGVEAVRALADVYGEALARVLDRADATLTEQLVADDLVSHLLLVHDLHPHDPVMRIERALAGLAPQVSAGLKAYDDGAAVVEVEGRAQGSAHAGEHVVEDTVRAVAPEVHAVTVNYRSEPAFVPLTAVRAR